MNPREVLGVGADAGQDEIARAYRRAARCTHPDAVPDDPTAAVRFGELCRAYDELRRAGTPAGVHPRPMVRAGGEGTAVRTKVVLPPGVALAAGPVRWGRR